MEVFKWSGLARYCFYSFLLIFSFRVANAQILTIQFDNIRNSDGEISLKFYAVKDNWLDEDVYYKEFIFPKRDVENSQIKVTIDSIPQGYYGIAVLDDEDLDGEMRNNFIGFPKEGFGFSNNVKPFIRRPKFQECVFEFKNDTTIQISIQYR